MKNELHKKISTLRLAKAWIENVGSKISKHFKFKHEVHFFRDLQIKKLVHVL
jgi:hypothetical protein